MVRKVYIEGANPTLVSKEEQEEKRYIGRDSNELVSSTFDKPSVGNRYEGSDADMDDLFYKNEDNISAIKKYYFKRFGHVRIADDEETKKDLVHDFITHMRWAEVNEVSAGTLAWYVNNSEKDEVYNFRQIYDAYKALPKFFQKGSEDETIGQRAFRFGEGIQDYVSGTLFSPSGILSIATAGTAKAGAMAANRAFIQTAIKNGIAKVSTQAAKGSLTRGIQKNILLPKKALLEGAKRGAMVDAVGAAATNLGTQTTRIGIGADEDFSIGQMALATTLGATPGALLGARAGAKAFKTTRQTERMLAQGAAKQGIGVLERTGRGFSPEVQKTLDSKDTEKISKEIVDSFNELNKDLSSGRRLKKEKLDPEEVAEGREALQSAGKTLGLDSDETIQVTLSDDFMKRIATAAKILIDEGATKGVVNPKDRVTKQVYDLLDNEVISPEVYRQTLDELGVDLGTFAKIVLAEGSDLGRKLGRLSIIKDKFLSVTANYGERTAYEKAMLELDKLYGAEGFGTLKKSPRAFRFNQYRKGILVSQPATAVRNFATVLGFQAIPNMLTTFIDRTINATIRGNPRKQGGLEEAKDIVMDSILMGRNIFAQWSGDQRLNLLTAEILKDLPKTQRKLFGNLFGETGMGTSTVGDMGVYKMDKFVQAINVLNRGQEHFYRTAAFMTSVERQLAEKGLSLTNIAKSGSLGKRIATKEGEELIDEGVIQKATDDALEFTFANLQDEETLYGSIANLTTNFINRTPLTLLIPFPRFMFAAMKYQYDYSPLGFLSSIGTTTGRTRIKKGDHTQLARNIVGSGMLTVAYMLKDSEYSGGEWYELTDPKTGRTLDTRALFPIPQYLFAADTIQRFFSGREKDTSKFLQDAQTAITGTNFRTGMAGGDFVNGIIDSISGGSEEKFVEAIVDTSASLLTQGLVFFRPINDVLMQYGGIEPYALEQRGTGISARGGVLEGASAEVLSTPAAQIAASLPFGVGQAIYEHLFNEEQKYAVDPTLPVGERVKRYNPILKQLFGATITEKSLTGKVLSYYGLDYTDTKIYTGDPGFDRQANIIYQRLIDYTLTPALADRTSRFNRIAEADRSIGNYKNTKLHLREELRALKKIAREEAKNDNPELWRAIKLWKDTSSLERAAYDIRSDQSVRDIQEGIATGSLQSRDRFGNLERDTKPYIYTGPRETGEERRERQRKLYGN